MKPYLIYIIAVITVVPIGALIAKLVTSWLAGFKPSYAAAILSSFVAYIVSNGVALALGVSGVLAGAPTARSTGVVLGLVALTCSHFVFLKSETGGRLTPAQALMIAVCQLIGGVIVATLIFIPIALAWRALS